MFDAGADRDARPRRDKREPAEDRARRRTRPAGRDGGCARRIGGDGVVPHERRTPQQRGSALAPSHHLPPWSRDQEGNRARSASSTARPSSGSSNLMRPSSLRQRARPMTRTFGSSRPSLTVLNNAMERRQHQRIRRIRNFHRPERSLTVSKAGSARGSESGRRPVLHSQIEEPAGNAGRWARWIIVTPRLRIREARAR